jgi:ABC-2 type transport system ATP-binding protein
MQLSVEKINKSFGTNRDLRDVSFTARSGAAFGLIGRNGSGKTTTIRVIMDVFPADSGTVTADGVPVAKSRVRFGYLPEERGLYPKRVISEQMAYLGELRGMTAADARRRSRLLLEKLEAGEDYKKKLETLSKGNQQKIQLAIALLNDPEIVILDEPFSGLDPVNARILKELVQELVGEGRIVIFSSHQMGSVEAFCDDVCMLDAGRIVLHGSLKQIKRTYPRDRILVVPEDGDGDALRRRLEADADTRAAAARITATPRGCEVTLKNERDKNALLAGVARAGIGLESFSVIEPTLEEIFVEKAGRADETV